MLGSVTESRFAMRGWEQVEYLLCSRQLSLLWMTMENDNQQQRQMTRADKRLCWD